MEQSIYKPQNQDLPATTRKKPGKAPTSFSLGAPEGSNLVNTLISGFWLPGQRGSISVVFSGIACGHPNVTKIAINEEGRPM